MLNKFLCFMWGHQFSQVWWYGYTKEFCKAGGKTFVAEWTECKHCGARHE